MHSQLSITTHINSCLYDINNTSFLNSPCYILDGTTIALYNQKDLRRPDDVSLKDRKDNFAYVQDDLCKEEFENIIDTKHKQNNLRE